MATGATSAPPSRLENPGDTNVLGIELADITAVILAGGLGMRLRSVVADRPKVLASVAGVPFLFHLLDQLSAAGVKHVVLATGFGAVQVRDTVGSTYGPIAIEYSYEATPAGTGGALRKALPYLRGGSTLALNGDSFCELDLPALCNFHQDRGALGTLALTRVADVRRFGTVETRHDGRITHFVEKSPKAGPGLINAGVYLLNRAMIEGIPEGVACSFEQTVLPRRIEAGIFGFATTGRFIDIGTPESLALADEFFRSSKASPSARDAATRVCIAPTNTAEVA